MLTAMSSDAYGVIAKLLLCRDNKKPGGFRSARSRFSLRWVCVVFKLDPAENSATPQTFLRFFTRAANPQGHASLGMRGAPADRRLRLD
jgi:hypothetical protein